MKKITRHLTGSLVLMVVCLVGSPAIAQLMPVPQPQMPSFNIFACNIGYSAHALEVFHKVKDALNVPREAIAITANQCVPNAMATIMPFQRPGPNGWPIYVPQKTILYNPAFMTQMEVTTGSSWSGISIIAHEVGHHVRNHIVAETPWDLMRSQWQKELEADYYSGLALAKLGASPSDLQKAQRQMFTLWGTPTHPDTVQRIHKINQGWKDGGGKGEVSTDLLKVWQEINSDLTKWWY